MSMLNCTELSKSNADDANIYSKTKFKNSLKIWTFPGFFLILNQIVHAYLDKVRKVPDEGRSWITLPKMLTILLVNF